MALQKTLTATTAILADPYLPKIIDHVVELQKLESQSAPTGTAPTPGIGLRYVEAPLALFVSIRRHPYVAAGVAAAVVGGIWYLGYSAGKRK